MPFEFNFSDDSSDEIEQNSKKLKIEEKHPPCQEVLPFVEVIPQFKVDKNQKFLSYYFKKDIVLKCVQTTVDISTDSHNRDQRTLNPDNENSDLIPRIYEGGFKVWECSLDMVEYFIEQNVDFHSKKVLELGCGCGLPGLYALMHSAEFVHFQDYNAEVLKHVVGPNVALNEIKKEASGGEDNVRFFAGDWSHFQEQDLTKYDLILSSETIYCPENYEKLHQIFEKFLDYQGACLVAAKTFYFGVGGGTRDFQDFVRKRGLFDVSSVTTFTEGVQREILSLKFKSKGCIETFD